MKKKNSSQKCTQYGYYTTTMILVKGSRMIFDVRNGTHDREKTNNTVLICPHNFVICCHNKEGFIEDDMYT